MMYNSLMDAMQVKGDANFWAKVDKGDGDGCWIFTGTPRGVYGQYGGTTAHRYAWISSGREIEDGVPLRHTCGVHKCVRLDHLEPATSVLDADERARRRAEAEARLARLRQEVDEGAEADLDGNERRQLERADRLRRLHPIFRAYLDELALDGDRSRATLYNAEAAMLRLDAWLRAEGIDAAAVPDLSVLRRYRLALMQDLAPATVNQHLCRVRGAYLNALELGMIERDPTLRVKYLDLERNEPKPLTNEEVRRVLAACRDDREHLLALVLAFTGMRKSEVTGLRWEAIDFDAQTIRLEAADTKTNTGRTIPLHPRLARALLAAPRPYSGTYVFETNRRGPMSGSHAHRLMVRLLARARVRTDQPWHVWRKTLAGTLRENDVSGDVIDAICGWAPRGMQLRRYAQVSLRQKREAIVRAYRDDPLEGAARPAAPTAGWPEEAQVA